MVSDKSHKAMKAKNKNQVAAMKEAMRFLYGAVEFLVKNHIKFDSEKLINHAADTYQVYAKAVSDLYYGFETWENYLKGNLPIKPEVEYELMSVKEVGKTTEYKTVRRFSTFKDAESALKALATILNVEVVDTLTDADDATKKVAGDATWRYQVEYNGCRYAIYEYNPTEDLVF